MKYRDLKKSVECLIRRRKLYTEEELFMAIYADCYRIISKRVENELNTFSLRYSILILLTGYLQGLQRMGIILEYTVRCDDELNSPSIIQAGKFKSEVHIKTRKLNNKFIIIEI